MINKGIIFLLFNSVLYFTDQKFLFYFDSYHYSGAFSCSTFQHGFFPSQRCECGFPVYTVQMSNGNDIQSELEMYSIYLFLNSGKEYSSCSKWKLLSYTYIDLRNQSQLKVFIISWNIYETEHNFVPFIFTRFWVLSALKIIFK